MVSKEYIRSVLENDDRDFIESLARQSRSLTLKHFGKAISLYAPLYLSNYCDNQCTYCGFNHDRKVERTRLSRQEMETEMQKIASFGIQNILLLTGESRQYSPVDYIDEAVRIARNYFASISLEVFPMQVAEYQRLYRSGVDGVTIYQETYQRERYGQLHPKGPKRDYFFRRGTPARIAEAGLRTISMGVLLGLSEITEDIWQLFSHLEEMQREYPGVEYSLSFPRIIPIRDDDSLNLADDMTLIKLICMARILFPSVGINLSTRENARLRDHIIGLGVTRVSAASKTTVGGYDCKKGETPQFDVMDQRSVEAVRMMIRARGFDPVLTDWRRIENG